MMNLHDILQKTAAGQELNEDEKNFIRAWQPENHNPKNIELEAANAKLNEALQDMQLKLEQAGNDKSAAESMLAEMQFRAAVTNIAGRYNFSDPDYLGFKLKTAGIELNDDAQAATFMDELKKSSPKLFKVNAIPGSGNAMHHIHEPVQRTGGTIEAMIAAAPQIKQ